MICGKTHTQLPLVGRVEPNPHQPKKTPPGETEGSVAAPRKLTQKRELAGSVFGRWTVLHQGQHFGAHIGWMCECDCGTIRNVQAGNLQSGKSVSCGCFKDECTRARKTHGATIGGPTKEYELWMAMKRRCYGKNTIGWHNYGGRGIRVCRRWKHSFENFLSDMGLRPSPKHSVERRDNNGNYTPKNCYWATKREQDYNKRNTRFITYKGTKMPLSDWAVKIGLNYATLLGRVLRGWSANSAIETPQLRIGNYR